MNFMKRSLLSIRKRISKSLILFVSFSIIAVLVLSGIVIQSASDTAKELAREKLGVTVTLKVDQEKLMTKIREEFQATGTRPTIEVDPIDLEVAKKISELDEVAGYNITNSVLLLADGFNYVQDESLAAQREQLDSLRSQYEDFGKDLESLQDDLKDLQSQIDEANKQNTTEQKPTDGGDRPVGGGGGMHIGNVPGINGMPTFDFNMMLAEIQASAVLDMNYLSDFTSGTKQLVSGELLNKDDLGKNVIVIEEEIANLNNLKVGDTVSVNSLNDETKKDFVIKGIYRSDDKFGTNIGKIMSESQIPANLVYIPQNVFASTNVEDASVNTIEYTLKDPLMVDSFLEKASTIEGIDWNTYVLDANNSEYEKMMGPIENVAVFAKLGVVGVAIAGAIILSLIAALSIKDRRYEIGVLLSLGESKVKIIGQLLLESLIILIIAFVVAIPLANTVSSQISNVLINNEVSVQEENNENNMRPGMGMFNNTDDVEVVDHLDTTIAWDDISKLYGIGFGIVLLSIIIPSLSVLRYNPRVILSNRD